MTRAEVRKILELYSRPDTLPADARKELEDAFVRSLKKEEKRRCKHCDHMDEVHNKDIVTGELHCLGGPTADCNCFGFAKS